MKISLKQAFDLINKASAMIWDDIGFISYPPSTSELTGENENEFLYLSATDEEGYEYSATFTEGENRDVTVKDNALILIDHEGEECRIVLLSVMDLSIIPDEMSEQQRRDEKNGLYGEHEDPAN